MKSPLVVSFEKALEEVISKSPEKFLNVTVWIWSDSDGLSVECGGKTIPVHGKRLAYTRGNHDELVELANEVIDEVRK